MIPLRDNIPSRTIPFVNYVMIGLCAVVFFIQLGQPDLTERLGMVPKRVFDPDASLSIAERQVRYGGRVFVVERPMAESPVPPILTLLTCIFLHGGWMHFLGNMWFLWIFGDNVEDRLGHLGFAVFYVGCGVAASAAHLLVNQDSGIPTIGASGAIAGVMGAYMYFYPKAKVLALVPIVYFLQMLVLPAPLFLGIWLLLQLFQGVASVATSAGGVAWWAHIGGFAVGFAVAFLLEKVGETRPAVEVILPGSNRIHTYRYRSRRL